VIVGVDPDPANGATITRWCKEERVRSSYRDHYDRLVEIKTKYDPTNVFRMNQNLRPVAAPV